MQQGNTIRKLALCSIMALVLAPLAACQHASMDHPSPGLNTSSRQEVVRTRAVDDSNPRAKLIVGSKDLVGYVVLLNPKFRQLGQMTQAQVTVQNLTENRYSLEYKCDWFDAHGFQVGPRPVWQRFTLTPMITKTVTSMGKVPEARNIVFTVRLPDDAFIDLDKRMEREK